MDRQLFDDLIVAGNQRTVEREYWLKKLAGDFQRGYIPYDYALSKQRARQKATCRFPLPQLQADACLRLANGSSYNLYIILCACLIILVSKYTASSDIVIGSPILKDEHAGDLLNMVIPLRVCLQEDMTFQQLLKHLKEIHLEGIAHQNYPIEMLVSHLDLEGPAGSFPLFDIVALLDETHIRQFFQHEGPGILFAFNRANSGVTLAIEYNTALYAYRTLERLARQFAYLLGQALEHTSDVAVLDLGVDTHEEYNRLIDGLNKTACTFPEHATVAGLFEETVARFPDHIALQAGTVQVTYSELNSRANKLARVLKKKGSRPETIIGIYAERSIEMVVGLLAILKADAAYLPLDPSYPAERVHYILQDSQVKLLVTQSHLAHNLAVDQELVLLDDEQLSFQENTNVESSHKASNLAYVIYTSGTTGNPKGVMVEHKQVVRLLRNDAFLFDFTENDTWTLFHSFCFDFSVWEMYGALLNGGRLIIVPAAMTLDIPSYLSMLREERVTVLNQTPSAFLLLAEEECKYHAQELALRYVIFGGEMLMPGRLQQWHQRYLRTKLINMYGITETTVHVTYCEIQQADIQAGISNIGRPIPTTSVYILDGKLKPVPIGAIGEIFVGGAGVARGYLYNQQLTQQRFLPDPFSSGRGRVYRTGDLGRWRNEGVIEYIGRADHQVKIRGFRIEPGEIEAQVLRFRGVRDAVVSPVPVTQGELALCAYVVLQPSLHPDESLSELKQHLVHCLPAYMLPAFIVPVDELPLTENGKLNRMALPDPRQYMKASLSYTPPSNQLERQLVEIWADILELPSEKIGIHDRFFDLGGNSLRVLALNNKVQKELGREMSVMSYFQYPTILSFIKHVIHAEEDQGVASLSSSVEAVEGVETVEVHSIMGELTKLAGEG